MSIIYRFEDYSIGELAGIVGKLIRDEKVGILPTDTIYGICCRYDDEKSIERIYDIKGRSKNKGFVHLVASFDDISMISESVIDDRLKAIMPGPISVIFDKGSEGVAIRFPDEEFIISVIRVVGVPIIATSANISGSNYKDNIDYIIDTFKGSVDFVVDRGNLGTNTPSTIIDYRNNTIRVVREGLAFDRVKRLLDKELK